MPNVTAESRKGCRKCYRRPGFALRILRTSRRLQLYSLENLHGIGRALHSAMDTPYDIQERTFLFACRIVDFCKPLFSAHPAYRELARQLIEAGTSVGANVEEADAGQSKPDFRSKIAIARKESREARYWLRLIAYAEPRFQPVAAPLIDEARQIYSILTAIKKTPSRGNPSERDGCQAEEGR